MTTALAIQPKQLKPGEQYPVLAKDGGRDILVMCRMTDDGLLRSLNLDIKLHENQGHYHKFIKGRLPISSTGYEYLNRYLGVKIYIPDFVMEDGKRKVNPFEVRNEKDELERVEIVAYGMGRNATGTFQVYKEKLTWDVNVVFAQDVYAKWETKIWNDSRRGYDRNYKEWGTLYNADNVPDKVQADPRVKLIPIPSTGTVLAATLTGDMCRALGDHINRLRFYSRTVHGILKARILRFFTGQRYASSDGFVKVCAWVEPDSTTIAEMQKVVEEAESGGLEKVDHVADVDADEMAFENAIDAEPREPFEPHDVQAPEPEASAADVLRREIYRLTADWDDGKKKALLDRNPSVGDWATIKELGEKDLRYLKMDIDKTNKAATGGAK